MRERSSSEVEERSSSLCVCMCVWGGWHICCRCVTHTYIGHFIGDLTKGDYWAIYDWRPVSKEEVVAAGQSRGRLAASQLGAAGQLQVLHLTAKAETAV